MTRKFSVIGLLVLGGLLASAASADELHTCIYDSSDIALQACTRAINSGEYKGVDLANAYINRGAEWLRKEDYDRAIADSTEALKLFPESTLAHNNRGLAWKHKGDLDRALADYSEAIRIDPDNPGAYINRAAIREQQGDKRGAIDDLKKALAAKPRKGKFVDVERYYQQAREALERLSNQ